MGTKKKDLEIIYNLQWKNKPANGGDKANIGLVGVYDIPATTLKWEVFKSYLLKNSGTAGDDVKVSFIADSNREFPIESQNDFQVALYAFRRKARLGEIVNLRLERISEQPIHKNLRHSNDVETQSDNNEAVSLSSTGYNNETPPEWFITYMNQFKKNFSDELIATVSTIVSNIKPHIVSQPSYYHHTRKTKPECPKRIRKLPTLLGESSHETKDLIKSLKLEGKLERKLEKLEHKTKKIKEKKLALLTKSSDSDAGPSTSRTYSYRQCEKEENLLEMDAAPVTIQSAIPHMLGGEVYLHQWEVINTGKVSWTSKTTLNFTWGSKALKPLDSVISVPYLKPGEVGLIAVRLQVPDHPGQYECYWHFHYKGRRFGHWLGCQVIVDPFDLKGNKSVLETSFVSEYITNAKKIKKNEHADEAVAQYTEIVHEPVANEPQKFTFNIEQPNAKKEVRTDEIVEDEDASPKNILDTQVREINTRLGDMKLQDPTDDTNCSSDSDNQSIISLSESNSSKSVPDEFVVVPIPDCFKMEEPSNMEIGPDFEITEDKDLVTDTVSNAATNVVDDEDESINNLPDQVLVNCDDNSKKTTQACGSASSVKTDDSFSSEGSQKSDIVLISIPNKEEEDNAGYAYLIVDGRRLPIPKKILNSEYLKLATEGCSPSKESVTRASSVTSVETSIKREEPLPSEIGNVDLRETIPVCSNEPPLIEVGDSDDQKLDDNNGDLMSHCSAAGSCFSDADSARDKSSRLFIFPQNCPGFEVFYPVIDAPKNPAQKYEWSETNPRYAYANSSPQPPPTASAPPLNLSTHNRNPFRSDMSFHVANFQQTPPEMRPTLPATVTMTTEEAVNVPVAQMATEVPMSGTAMEVPMSDTATEAPMSDTAAPEPAKAPENSTPIHILPETLVTGAVNVASSAINTARSVINMIVPREAKSNPQTSNDVLQPGRWVNGHWVSTNPETPREANLQALAEMGFWNRDLNATLLARYNDDLSRVVAELIQ